DQTDAGNARPARGVHQFVQEVGGGEPLTRLRAAPRATLSRKRERGFQTTTFRNPSPACGRGRGHGRQAWEGEVQCRKCLSPVNTIATPALSAAAITSSSRRDPPGWMTAVIPASMPTSSPSANGKNASDAITAPFTGDSVSPAA